MMAAAVWGCLLVAASVYLGAHSFLQIAVCTVGWTVMDFGYEMAQYFSERFSECVCKKHKTDSENEQELSIFSKVESEL